MLHSERTNLLEYSCIAESENPLPIPCACAASIIHMLNVLLKIY